MNKLGTIQENLNFTIAFTKERIRDEAILLIKRARELQDDLSKRLDITQFTHTSGDDFYFHKARSLFDTVENGLGWMKQNQQEIKLLVEKLDTLRPFIGKEA